MLPRLKDVSRVRWLRFGRVAHSFGMPDTVSGFGAKSLFEKVRLILFVEANLKPNAASGVRNWFE